MIVNPSVDQILEGVMMSLEDDIAPAVTNPKASATIQMIQSLLQGGVPVDQCRVQPAQRFNQRVDLLRRQRLGRRQLQRQPENQRDPFHARIVSAHKKTGQHGCAAG